MLDSAMLDIASGAFDYNTVLMRTVKQLTNSGLRSVDYATGWSNRVDVAARRAVMTGMSQLTAKVNEDNMTALDTEYVEVSWHSGARPSVRGRSPAILLHGSTAPIRLQPDDHRQKSRG